MPKRLTPDQAEACKRDGYCAPVRVMSAADAHGYRAALEAHEAITGQPLQGNWRHKTHLLFTWADALVHHPVILDAVEDAIGTDRKFNGLSGSTAAWPPASGSTAAANRPPTCM